MAGTTTGTTTTTTKPDVEDSNAPENKPGMRLRRSTRSDFNLEPNPFEQSFRTPHSSNVRQSNGRSTSPPVEESNGASSNESKATDSNNKQVKQKSETPPPVLPPVATIASPADPNNFSQWGFSPSLTNSLRAGPLSPAMLAGPQMGGNGHMNYDPNTYRSGFTPRTGLTPRTGMTPGLGSGLTPLIGGPVSFPPPSPNTAAFLALMNANQQNAHSSSSNNLHQSDTITPNTFSAITGGAFAPAMMNKAGDQNQYGIQNGQHRQEHQQHNQENNNNNNNTAAAASYAASTAADGLFLLSQAHQELTKRDEAARAAASENNSDHAPVAKNGAGGRKRKAAAATTAPKRTRGSARSRTVEADYDDDDDEDESMHDYNAGDNKNETEEEKRKNFLERNRQAALKCRQRKKAWLAQLQSQNEYLKAENDRLQTALVAAREEISRLSGIAGAPTGKAGPGQPVSVNVPVGKGAGGNNARGYGY